MQKEISMKNIHKKIPSNKSYKSDKFKRIIPFLLIVFLFMLTCQQSLFAEEKPVSDIPNRYGMSIVTGDDIYDPKNDVTFVQISGFALFDHEKIFPLKAPEALRFKIEGSLGSLTRPEKRLIVSANIISLYYINLLATKTFKPYVEGGIGAIYTDYKFRGQGTRFNFNPQLGIGTEIAAASGEPFFTALRLYHVSNAGLSKENRGLNAITLHIGRFF
jgi:lipid A 3-O-deacylase